MGQFLGFGSSGDGIVTLSGTEAPIDSTAATSGLNLAATNASFVANQMILIHQSQGPNVGGWEINQIQSYSAGTIVPQVALANTYSLSGGNAHQVRVIPQYASVSITGTYTGKTWNGSVGGLVSWLCNGATTISGTLSAKGIGFRGGAAPPIGVGGSATRQGNQGESYTSLGSHAVSSANDSAGGAGLNGGGDDGGGGGGASHATIGTAATNGTGGAAQGQGGSVGSLSPDTSDLLNAIFGSGGGSGCSDDGCHGGQGGEGGGGIFLWTYQLIVTGSIDCDGVNGYAPVQSGGGSGAGGGAGAAGFCMIFSKIGTLGINLIHANGGIGSSGITAFGDTGGNGGNSGSGRIRIEICTVTDSATYSTSPTATIQIGGFSWCSVYSQIF